MSKVFILGKGRIGQALAYYLQRQKIECTISNEARDVLDRDISLIIGTLPGGMGDVSLRLALEHKVDLIDLADLEVDVYLNAKNEIEQAGIRVIPGCGFCPGLVNFILGHEIASNASISSVEVKVGSLSPESCYFPFLWCFEDMVLEFMNPSLQVIEGKPQEFPPFAKYREEELFGIPTETFLCQSGFENLATECGIRNFTFRNIRPVGFRYFFEFLHKNTSA